MARRRLHNDDWGYETNCFVCEQRNSEGLRVPFWVDDEAQVVEGEFRLGHAYSGAPTLVHGGVQLALCDEAMAWAAIALAGRWALTASSTAEFTAPVACDVDHVVRARVVGHDGDQIRCSAEIVGVDGTVCTRTTARFVAIGEAVATNLLGEVRDAHRQFLADS